MKKTTTDYYCDICGISLAPEFVENGRATSIAIVIGKQCINYIEVCLPCTEEITNSIKNIKNTHNIQQHEVIE